MTARTSLRRAAVCGLLLGLLLGCERNPRERAEPAASPDPPGEAERQASADRAIPPPAVDVDPSPAADDPAEDAPANDPAESAGAASSGGEEPEGWEQWPDPEVVLVLSGHQHGYIEPCGCTGLANQKGGLARRHSLIKRLRDRDWDVVPLDAGNQVRRFGRQPEIKFQTTVAGLEEMGYRAVGFGPDDLKLGVGELLAVAAGDAEDSTPFVSANVVLLDPELTPRFQVVDAGGRKIGVSAALAPEEFGSDRGGDISVEAVIPEVEQVAEALEAEGCDYRVLLLFGDAELAAEIARAVPVWDTIVVAGDLGEPTHRPEPVEGTPTGIIRTGHKGMHVCLLGLFDDVERPTRYARVPLSDAFEDSPEMMELMASYQQQLQALGLEGLGLRPITHPSGRQFVGSETCGECHSTAFDIWEGTPHAHATDSLAYPNERVEIPRHFDPECLSCHVTGWNPQKFYPYESGYLGLEETPQLTASGCENCHGPGSDHVAAERGEVDVDDERLVALREAMRLPLDRAREKCLECHDLDNSPDFHTEGAFEDVYWPQVEHYGLD